MTSPSSFDWESVLDRLSAFYHTGDWRKPYLRDHAENPFQVLIGTILSQRTRDEATDVASARLFARFPDAPRLSRARPAAIEPLIRGTGFYHTKARVIRACASEILTRFSGTVPNTSAELLSLPGVGPKTANCVPVFGYGIPAIPVDTHVHRIANRLGVVRTRTPEETEERLREVLPREYLDPDQPTSCSARPEPLSPPPAALPGMSDRLPLRYGPCPPGRAGPAAGGGPAASPVPVAGSATSTTSGPTIATARNSHPTPYDWTETTHPNRNETTAPPLSWIELNSPIASGISSDGTVLQKWGRTYITA